MYREKVCLTHRTMYSVSDSVSSTGRFEDLNSGPRLANSGTAPNCSAYTSCLDAATLSVGLAVTVSPASFPTRTNKSQCMRNCVLCFDVCDHLRQNQTAQPLKLFIYRVITVTTYQGSKLKRC